MLNLGPKLEVMQMPNGQFGERVTQPDGKAECWLNGAPCDPDVFEAMLKEPDPKASVWRVQ